MVGDSQSRRLSVLLVTYNQERYLRRALRSLLDQSFDGPIELIVADDGSSDGTIDVIREHQDLDERVRFAFLADHGHLGVTGNYRRGLQACSGDYVAVLEGDDYWVSPDKLKRQYEFLESHWECDLCAVNYFIYDEDKGRFAPRTPIGTGYRYLDAAAVIADNPLGNFSACMYRRSALEALAPALFELESYDWIVNICVARTSMLAVLNEPMSVYRRHSGGVWNQNSDTEKLRRQLDSVRAYDELTEYCFHEEFEALGKRLRYSIRTQTATHGGRGLASAAFSLLDRYPRSRRVPDYVPPVMISIGRALVPRAIRWRLARIIEEDERT